MVPDMPNGIWNTATTTMKVVAFKGSSMARAGVAGPAWRGNAGAI